MNKDKKKMKKKITLEQEISLFLESWNLQQMKSFLTEILDIAELYNVEDGDDWVEDKVGVDNASNVRLVRTVYCISRLAEFHIGKLLKMKVDFPHIWERIKQQAEEQREKPKDNNE